MEQMISGDWRLRRFAEADFPWGDEIGDVRLLESVYDSGSEKLPLKELSRNYSDRRIVLFAVTIGDFIIPIRRVIS
ncbi:MAG: hypothetical protein HDQ87_01395 [Clostridia bacterium]|nr:hypothetical protein [Clostridia bacterium]